MGHERAKDWLARGSLVARLVVIPISDLVNPSSYKIFYSISLDIIKIDEGSQSEKNMGVDEEFIEDLRGDIMSENNQV